VLDVYLRRFLAHAVRGAAGSVSAAGRLVLVTRQLRQRSSDLAAEGLGRPLVRLALGARRGARVESHRTRHGAALGGDELAQVSLDHARRRGGRRRRRGELRSRR